MATNPNPNTEPVVPSYTPLLWDWKAPQNNIGAFKLVPKSNGGLINIFDQFDWTLTPPAGRYNIPKVILTEYRQTQSSELRGYLYDARGKVSNLALAGAVGAAPLAAFTREAGSLTKTVTNQAAAYTTDSGSWWSKTATGISNIVNTGIDKGVGLVTGGAAAVQNKSTEAITDSSAATKEALDPYYGLYATELTGFTYAFPYYSDTNMMDISNQWGDSSAFKNAARKTGGGIASMIEALSPDKEGKGGGDGGEKEEEGGGINFKKVFGFAKGIKDTAVGATELGLASTAGALVAEKPKAFTGSSASDSVRISFYLYNTFDNGGDVSSLQRNWEFCYMFTYQNLPNRLGINLLDAPCLYSIDISGYKHIPLATLEDIKIKNVGNVRLVNITTGETVEDSGSQNQYIKMMPEAYKVEFTLKSVLTNTRNLFLHNADPGRSINITVQLPTK